MGPAGSLGLGHCKAAWRGETLWERTLWKQSDKGNQSEGRRRVLQSSLYPGKSKQPASGPCSRLSGPRGPYFGNKSDFPPGNSPLPIARDLGGSVNQDAGPTLGSGQAHDPGGADWTGDTGGPGDFGFIHPDGVWGGCSLILSGFLATKTFLVFLEVWLFSFLRFQESPHSISIHIFF